MADPRFREDQWQRRYEPHIKPINRLVDSLRDEATGSWLPYVAPIYGGRDARLLSLLRDPGPRTREGEGSGFLSMENDDPTAEAISRLFTEAGINACDVVPWNVYPWYINRAPKAAELEAGIEPLRRLIELLPRLRVVMLHGGSAKDGWQRFSRRLPLIVRGLHVVPTYHTSRQAFWHRDPEVRDARRRHLHQAFQQSAGFLNNA